MFGEIKVGDINVPMLANGATPLRYRMLFKRDLIATFHKSEDSAQAASECIPELAFVMAKQAEAQKEKDGNLLNTLSQNDFMTWLEQFGPMDLLNASDGIIDLYTGNQETTTEAKKKEDQVKES